MHPYDRLFFDPETGEYTIDKWLADLEEGERKLTLPVIKAVAGASEAERAFWVRTIEKGDQRDGDLDEALAILARHEALERTRADAEGWTAKAKEAIGLLPAHPVRDMLRDLADYVVVRLA